MSFDILGRVTRSKQTTDNVEYGTDANPMTYIYNLSGALIEQKYPSGRVVKNTLDSDGDLAQVHSQKNATAILQNYANSFVYTAAGAASSLRLGNGKFENTQFNSRLQPTQIGLGSSSSTQNLLKLNYDYGAEQNNGNVLSQTITVPTVGTNTGFAGTQTYTYDSLNRIKDTTENVTPNGGSTSQSWKQTFLYDRYGNRNFDTTANRTTTIPLGCAITVCNPSVDPATNKLVGYQFDNAGNTKIDANGQTFTYDSENKQVEVRTVANALVGQYYYDGDGKRIKKYVPATGGITIFVYDAAGKQIAEYSTILADASTAKVAYLTADHLGSPRINTDVTGAVTSRHDYHPFGEEIATSQRTSGLGYADDTVRKQFTGYERDGETDLDFAQARMFNNSHGRFTSPDNFLNDTHTPAPQSWNLYVYARNNPLKFIDPDGEKIYAGRIKDEADRNKLLERINYTYGCESCASIDKDGYIQVNTDGLRKEVIEATQYLTDAINADASKYFSMVLVENGSNDISFGASGTVTLGKGKDAKTVNAIFLDFKDSNALIGSDDVKKAFDFTTFAHEVRHQYPEATSDPDSEFGKSIGKELRPIQ